MDVCECATLMCVRRNEVLLLINAERNTKNNIDQLCTRYIYFYICLCLCYVGYTLLYTPCLSMCRIFPSVYAVSQLFLQ